MLRNKVLIIIVGNHASNYLTQSFKSQYDEITFYYKYDEIHIILKCLRKFPISSILTSLNLNLFFSATLILNLSDFKATYLTLFYTYSSYFASPASSTQIFF